MRSYFLFFFSVHLSIRQLGQIEQVSSSRGTTFNASNALTIFVGKVRFRHGTISYYNYYFFFFNTFFVSSAHLSIHHYTSVQHIYKHTQTMICVIFGVLSLCRSIHIRYVFGSSAWLLVYLLLMIFEFIFALLHLDAMLTAFLLFFSSLLYFIQFFQCFVFFSRCCCARICDILSFIAFDFIQKCNQ